MRKVVEVQRGDFMGQFIGSTEEKTTNKIEEAKGNALFVDEAYRLTQRSSETDYGCIAINQLMVAMERGNLMMIFVGYPTEMKEFFTSNPRLKSRIKYKFTFPEYCHRIGHYTSKDNCSQRFGQRFAASKMDGWLRTL